LYPILLAREGKLHVSLPERSLERVRHRERRKDPHSAPEALPTLVELGLVTARWHCVGMPAIPDPTTAVEVYAAQKLLVPLAHRVLGDTADYLGAGLKNWTERRAENVQKILKRADERLTDEERKKGAVPPRVIKGVLEDGSFADDPLVQSYFGGVLAASRSANARDDRGRCSLLWWAGFRPTRCRRTTCSTHMRRGGFVNTPGSTLGWIASVKLMDGSSCRSIFGSPAWDPRKTSCSF